LRLRSSGTDPQGTKITHTVVRGNGASNEALVERLFITEHTSRNHLNSIFQKLGVANRLELDVYAVKLQLGRLPS
jgi:two-component system nitrate/nitrite response regulator NarL